MEPIAAGESGFEHWLRWISLALFASLPVALLFSRGAADAMVVAIALSFLATVMLHRRWAVFRHPMLAALLITWLILNIAVSPFAVDPEASFSRSIPWLRFIIFFSAISFWVVRTRRDVTIIVLAWGAVLLGVAADGAIQLLFGMSLSGQPIFSNRLTGPLDRPNIGIFVARLGLPLMAAWVWLAETRKHQQIVYAKSMVVSFATVMVLFVFLTGERAASLLTIIALATVIALVVLRLPRYRLHGFLGLAAVAIVVTAILATSERILQRALATIDVVTDLWGSIYGELIRAGWRIWLDNPLTGVGLKNYRMACDDIRSEMRISECNPHPHNIYVEWLSEAGIVASLGFAAFVALFLLMLVKAFSRDSGGSLAGAFLVGSSVVTLFPFTVSQSFFSNWPAILLWSSLALAAAMARVIVAKGDRHS